MGVFFFSFFFTKSSLGTGLCVMPRLRLVCVFFQHQHVTYKRVFVTAASPPAAFGARLDLRLNPGRSSVFLLLPSRGSPIFISSLLPSAGWAAGAGEPSRNKKNRGHFHAVYMCVCARVERERGGGCWEAELIHCDRNQSSQDHHDQAAGTAHIQSKPGAVG